MSLALNDTTPSVVWEQGDGWSEGLVMQVGWRGTRSSGRKPKARERTAPQQLRTPAPAGSCSMVLCKMHTMLASGAANLFRVSLPGTPTKWRCPGWLRCP